jgi:outer membrane receptor protein involved in Fe transport
MEYQHEKLNNRAVLTDEALPLVDRNQVDWLPSLTLRYQLTDRMNLKLTNYQSVSRPNLRELTNFTYYHFINAVYWTGNPVLKRTYISNVDLRWEWFPSGLDQFSFTLFYKHFNNPIEQYIQEGSIGVVQQLSLVNRERGSATGLELEARKNLGFLAPGTQLGNLTVYFNLAVLQSRINSDFALFQTGRSLQGQSPAVFNAGVFYTYPDWQLTAGVFYNVTGQRIAIVGTGPESFPDIWERRRHVVDLQVAKRFGNKLEVKAALQDIFNMPIQTAQFYDGKTTYDPDRSRLITNIQRGLRAIVSVSYTFQ